MDQKQAIKVELRWLRTRQGLSLGRLQDCKALREALGNGPVEQDETKLRGLIDRLGTTDHAVALRWAFGIDYKARALEGKDGRRTLFAKDRGISPYTAENWEDEAIAELLLLLLKDDDHKPLHEGQVWVTVDLDTDGLPIQMTVQQPEPDGPMTKQVLIIEPQYFHQRVDFPMVMYRVPDNFPVYRYLSIGINCSGTRCPQSYWGTRAENPFFLMMRRGEPQLAREMPDGLRVWFENPRPGWYYALLWQWEPPLRAVK